MKKEILVVICNREEWDNPIVELVQANSRDEAVQKVINLNFDEGTTEEELTSDEDTAISISAWELKEKDIIQ